MKVHTPLLIAGPTASGKSSLAIEACKMFNGEIINADSMQIYKYLPILTDQPSKKIQQNHLHHLYGTQHEPCSVANWLSQANIVCDDIQRRNKRPIFVGGTGLYFKALINGIDHIPDISTPVRSQVRKIQQELSKDEFFILACENDPLILNNLNRNDSQRIARALEVFFETNKSLFKYQNQKKTPLFTYEYIQLMPPREWVYDRIKERIDNMFEQDVIGEVLNLEKVNLADDHPVLRAIGVPQIKKYLTHELPLDEVKKDMAQKSRNYAKRQYTWFNNQEKPHARITSTNEFVSLYKK